MDSCLRRNEERHPAFAGRREDTGGEKRGETEKHPACWKENR